jgi:hypothetical protein
MNIENLIKDAGKCDFCHICENRYICWNSRFHPRDDIICNQQERRKK